MQLKWACVTLRKLRANSQSDSHFSSFSIACWSCRKQLLSYPTHTTVTWAKRPNLDSDIKWKVVDLLATPVIGQESIHMAANDHSTTLWREEVHKKGWKTKCFGCILADSITIISMIIVSFAFPRNNVTEEWWRKKDFDKKLLSKEMPLKTPLPPLRRPPGNLFQY